MSAVSVVSREMCSGETEHCPDRGQVSESQFIDFVCEACSLEAPPLSSPCLSGHGSQLMGDHHHGIPTQLPEALRAEALLFKSREETVPPRRPSLFSASGASLVGACSP